MSSGVLLGRRFSSVSRQYLLWSVENKTVEWANHGQLEEKTNKGMSILGLPKRFPASRININKTANLYFSSIYDYVDEVTYVTMLFGRNPVAHFKLDGYWDDFGDGTITYNEFGDSKDKLLISVSILGGFSVPDTMEYGGFPHQRWGTVYLSFDLVTKVCSVNDVCVSVGAEETYTEFPYKDNRFISVGDTWVLDKKYRKYFRVNHGNEDYLESLGVDVSSLRYRLSLADDVSWSFDLICLEGKLQVTMKSTTFGKLHFTKDIDGLIPDSSAIITSISCMGRFESGCMDCNTIGYSLYIEVDGCVSIEHIFIDLFTMRFSSHPHSFSEPLQGESYLK